MLEKSFICAGKILVEHQSFTGCVCSGKPYQKYYPHCQYILQILGKLHATPAEVKARLPKVNVYQICTRKRGLDFATTI